MLGRETDGVRSFRGTVVGVDAALLQAAFDEAEKPRVFSADGAVEVRSTAQVTAVVTLEELRLGAGWIDGADESVSALTIEQRVYANGRSLLVM